VLCRGRPSAAELFLSELADDSRSRYYKGGLDRYRGGNGNFALVIVSSCGFEVEPDGLHEGIEVIDDSLVEAIEL